MLTTTKLTNAKISTTQNWFLKTVWDLVQYYNTHSNLPNIEKINILERILVGAGEWLTSHPPKATATNQARWAAMDDLARQVIDEGAKLGARFLTGPTNWKSIDNNQHGRNRSYWLEYLSPQHGVGFQLASIFEAWRKNGQPHESFWDYARLNPPHVPLLVKYYGGNAKAEKRRVVFKEDGKLYYAISGALFHSQPLTTVVSGTGWAIFVVSPEGKMYAHKHVTGIYHHSTFLSGSAVMAAGELVVDQGVVKFITAKSGHYAPTPENMRAFIRQFPKIPGQAVIMPDFKSNPPPAYTVAELKFTPNPKMLKRAQAVAGLPGWANANNSVINKIQP
ncbi:MAG: hypothetical protein KDJ28_02170 [Candidatus Competibacteraceae bacterium]|nr:hypothetical protein [Candidatus Competibacteraceae bacterium]